MLTANTQSVHHSAQAHEDTTQTERIIENSLVATSSSTSARISTANRQVQYLHTKRALKNTKRPAYNDKNDIRFNRSSIKVSGGGNYGQKGHENGKEVAILNSDVLRSVSNATVVLVDGNELERVAVLDEFDQFLKHCPDDCINIMVPEICSEMISWNTEMQMMALNLLYGVVKMKTPAHVSHQIVYGALDLSVRTQNKEIFESCGDIATMILDQVHRYHVLQSVIPFVVNRSTCERSLYRSLAARLIGYVGDGLSGDELWAILGNTIHDLAHDPDDGVRAMVGESMGVVGEKLSLEAVEQHLYPLLEKLYNDQERGVSMSSLKAIARTAVAHRSNSRRSFLYRGFFKEVFTKECVRATATASRDVRTVHDNIFAHLEKFAEMYGRLLYALSDFLETDEIWVDALDTLRLMVTCNSPLVRRWSSYNMPAITKVCGEKGKTNHIEGLVTSLARDTDLDTRATLAGGLHEITRFLYRGPLSGEILQAISTVMSDSDGSVQTNVLAHFSEIADLVSPCARGRETRAKAKLIRKETHLNGTDDLEDEVLEKDDLTSLELVYSSLKLISFTSWRTQLLLAEQLEKCAQCIPQDMLCDHIVPLVFQMARESTSVVRKASMEALVHMIKYVPNVTKRDDIVDKLKMEWARGGKYWMRLAFIDAAELASKKYSHSLFTKLFKGELLGMGHDSVINIRHRIACLLDGLVLVWKDDETFRDTVMHLALDSDVDVRESAMLALKKIGTSTGPTEEEIRFNKEMVSLEAEFYMADGGTKGSMHSVGNPHLLNERYESENLATHFASTKHLEAISASACDSEEYCKSAEILSEEAKFSTARATLQAISMRRDGDENAREGSSVSSSSSSGNLREAEPGRRKWSIFKRVFLCCFRGC